MKHALSVTAVLAIVAPGLRAPAGRAGTFHEAPLTCTIPIIDPNAVVVNGVVKHPPGTDYAAGPKNALSSVDFAGAFKRNFGAQATFTLPRAPRNTGLFYSNWVLLKSLESPAFVQIELMRWKKYHYRSEVGLTWALPDGRLIYRDTRVWLSDAAHRLGIAESHGTIALNVDGSTVCSAPARAFFSPSDRVYYQLGTEVAKYGDHPVGTMSDIEVKSDGDRRYHSLRVRCVYRGFGTSWQYRGNGAFHAAGVFDPTQPYRKFTGLHWNEPCRF